MLHALHIFQLGQVKTLLMMWVHLILNTVCTENEQTYKGTLQTFSYLFCLMQQMKNASYKRIPKSLEHFSAADRLLCNGYLQMTSIMHYMLCTVKVVIFGTSRTKELLDITVFHMLECCTQCVSQCIQQRPGQT